MTWNGLACLHVKIRKPSNGCGFLSSGHKIFHHFMQNGHGSCRNISAAALVHRVLYCIPFTSTTISWHTSVIHHRTRLFISSSTAGSVGEVTFCHPWMIVKAQQHTVEIQIMQSWWTIISLFLPLLILSHFLFLTLFWRSEPKRASFRWWISVHCDLFRLKIGSRRSNVHL